MGPGQEYVLKLGLDLGYEAVLGRGTRQEPGLAEAEPGWTAPSVQSGDVAFVEAGLDEASESGTGTQRGGRT